MDFLAAVSFFKKWSYLLCLIAIIFYIQFRLQSVDIWLIMPAFLLSFISAGTEFSRPFLLTLIAGFCAAAGAYLAAIIHFPLLLAGYLFILAALGTYLYQMHTQYFLPVFIAAVLIILSLGQPLSPAENNNRFLLFSISIFITALLQIIFVSSSSKNELKINKFIVLKNLKELNQVLFSCFLSQEYSDNIYLYERRLHEQKKQYLKGMQTFKKILQSVKAARRSHDWRSYEIFIAKADVLFNNMMDYAQLRRRVTDYTTLSVCSQELRGIFSAIQTLMDDVIYDRDNEKLSADIQTLMIKINNLEDNYYHVLQVASREPLVFLLFITSLRTFAENIKVNHAGAD